MHQKYCIKTSGIVIGKIYKYDDFCDVLEIECERDTKKKDRILEGLKQAIDYERIGTTKYKVNRIIKDWFILFDERMFGNNSSYNKKAPDLLLDHLLYHAKGEVVDGKKQVFISEREIQKVVGFCNSNYGSDKHIEGLISTGKATRLDVQLFYTAHSSKCKDVITSTMSQLKARLLTLRYEKLFLIEADEGQRITTREESEFIRDCKRKVLEEMQISKEYLVYLRNKQHEFYEKLDKKLLKLKCFEIVREGYFIKFPVLVENSGFKLDDGDRQIYLAGANKLLCDYLENEASKKESAARIRKEILENYNPSEHNDDLTKTKAFSQKKGDLTKLPPDHYEKQKFLIEDLVQL